MALTEEEKIRNDSTSTKLITTTLVAAMGFVAFAFGKESVRGELQPKINALEFVIDSKNSPKLGVIIDIMEQQQNHPKDSFTYKALQEKLDKLAAEARKELGLKQNSSSK